MDLWRISVRALVAYVYLLATTRASGKRVVRQATAFDLIISLIIGDLIDDMLWAEVSAAQFGSAVGAIFLCDAVTKLAAWKWHWAFRLVNGLPAPLLLDGLEDRDALRREQLTEEDLAHLLRLQGIENWNDVHLALAERDHELSVILSPAAEPASRADAERVKAMSR